MTFFSVIMPSFLGQYKNAARQRDKKIVRAVNSVFNQTFQDFEIIIIADGCQKTVDVIKTNFKDERIRLWHIAKQELWSGEPRNEGIRHSTGEWVVYLDIDDIYDKDYLLTIKEQLTDDIDWCWFNDFQFNKKTGEFIENRIMLTKGKCGTSNICHKRTIDVLWQKKGTYLHDWYIILELMKRYPNYIKLQKAPGYCICHIPNLIDV